MKKVLIFADFDKFGGTRTYLKNLIEFYRLYNYQIVTAIEKERCDQDILDFLTKNQIKIVFQSEKYERVYFHDFIFWK